MTDSNSKETGSKVTPLRCLIGATISGGLAFALYRLTTAIAQTYASKEVTSSSPIAVNIAIAVRTLVMGASAFATFVFGLATVGLILLGIQLLVQSFKERSISSSKD